MKKEDKRFLFTSLRYFTILILGLGNLALFYWIFTPLTISISFYFLKLIEPSALTFQANILFKGISIYIVPACVAGSAYYLLTILALSTANLKPLKRLILLSYLFAVFLSINVARIVLFSNIATSNLFETLHLIGWYLVSTVFVILIWFSAVFLFKLKGLPVYTDFKFLISYVKKSNKKSKKRKNSKSPKKN